MEVCSADCSAELAPPPPEELPPEEPPPEEPPPEEPPDEPPPLMPPELPPPDDPPVEASPDEPPLLIPPPPPDWPPDDPLIVPWLEPAPVVLFSPETMPVAEPPMGDGSLLPTCSVHPESSKASAAKGTSLRTKQHLPC